MPIYGKTSSYYSYFSAFFPHPWLASLLYLMISWLPGIVKTQVFFHGFAMPLTDDQIPTTQPPWTLQDQKKTNTVIQSLLV